MNKITDEEFRQLAQYIKAHSGIHLRDEKRTLLVGRLGSILNELGINNFMDYYKYLTNDKEGKELSRLIDKITTNHTYFMREPEHFNYFSQHVLPYLRSTVTKKDLRIWCAASSTGEEPYTLAMLMEDFFRGESHLWDKKLLATDISISVLEAAKKGIYSAEKVNSLPKLWIMNYFEKLNKEEYKVKESLKKQVVYRRFNLLEPTFPFKNKFHVIFCRNVMIYFDNETKNQVIEKLYDHLEYGGYLFIGHSESINREKSSFKYIRPAVYRKI